MTRPSRQSGFAVGEHLPIIDHHCHSLLRQTPADVAAFRALFTESREIRFITQHLLQTVFYRRTIADLQVAYGVSGEETLVRTVAGIPPLERARKLFAAAGLQMLLVDTGYRAEESLTLEELSTVVPARPILRIERTAEDLLAQSDDFDSLMVLLLGRIREAAASGHVALKTVLAYRTGLRVQSHPAQTVRRAFAEVKAGAEGGRVRLDAKPLLDTMIWEVCRAAGPLGLPVQVHSGFGDADLLLPEADPAWLRPLFEDPLCGETTFVLLHCYPFVREAAWLCGVYGHVYMDLSLTIPLIAHEAATALVEALAYAPWSKVLLGTDAHSTPELFYVAARALREATTTALQQIRSRGYLTDEDLPSIAAALLAENARHVYRLDSPQQGAGRSGLTT